MCYNNIEKLARDNNTNFVKKISKSDAYELNFFDIGFIKIQNLRIFLCHVRSNLLPIKEGIAMYRYETHLHTSPVSICAKKTVRENLEFYKSLGYDGVFITNHFLDGNFVARNTDLSYEEKIKIYISDYTEGSEIGKELGIRVFFGVELSYRGTDFLVYGLEPEWYLAHPEIMEMEKSTELPYLIKEGGFVVHAHPFREATYIDHIRLFPRCIQGVEVFNANRTAFENKMADRYADSYGFCKTAGSDNHAGEGQKILAGLESDTPIKDVNDFIERVKNGEMSIFIIDRKNDSQ